VLFCGSFGKMDDQPRPPYLLKLDGPSLAHGGVVMVVDPRDGGRHFASCSSCAPTKAMTMSTFVQKHKVHGGKNCSEGSADLPPGSLYLPLDEIKGWRTVPADENGQPSLGVEEMEVSSPTKTLAAESGGSAAYHASDDRGSKKIFGRDQLLVLNARELGRMAGCSHVGKRKEDLVEKVMVLQRAGAEGTSWHLCVRAAPRPK